MRSVTLYTPRKDGWIHVPISGQPRHGLKYARLRILARIDDEGQLVARVGDDDGTEPIANVEAGPDLIVAQAIANAIASAVVDALERGTRPDALRPASIGARIRGGR